jgi:sulfate adenylyltransferase
MVAPHGGSVVDRIVPARDVSGLLRLVLDARELADLELIAVGAASPLTGFLGRADYERVLAESRLASGVVWPLPFTLAAPEPGVSGEVALADGRGRVWGVLRVAETFRRDPRAEALAVYGTDDPSHPGVAYTLSRPEWAVGGEVEVFPLPDLPFQRYRLTPAALRAEIARRGWKRVAGFQTRNPIHRAHEHLTKLALEQTDGLVLHPLVGETKNDDVPAAVGIPADAVGIAPQPGGGRRRRS